MQDNKVIKNNRAYYDSLPKWHEPHWNYDRYGNPIKKGTPSLEEFRANRAPKPQRQRRLNDVTPAEWNEAARNSRK